MDVLNQLVMGFQVAATPVNLLWALIGAFVGTIVGVLPGIGPLGSMAILLSFTLNMEATTAMIFFAVAAPTPGSSINCAAVAVFRLTLSAEPAAGSAVVPPPVDPRSETSGRIFSMVAAGTPAFSSSA